MSTESQRYLSALRREMDRRFDLDEVKLLCFDLGVDYEHIAGETKPLKIHNLVLTVARHDRVSDLLDLLGEFRPNTHWPSLPPDFDIAPKGTEGSSPFEEPPFATQVNVGDVGTNAAVAVGPGASVNVQSYQISGDIMGDVHIAGDVQITSELPIPAPPAPVEPPLVDGFVGREQELAFFGETLRTVHTAIISGMAGVGKTTLAATLARRAARAEKIFWHSFHPGEGVESIIWQLAGFLAWHGEDDIWQLLQRTRLTRGNPPPAETLIDYLLQMLRGRDFLLCLDDFQFAEQDPQVNLLVERVRTAVFAGDLSIILTSRRLPEFVRTVDTVPLTGLGIEATQQLMRQRGVSLSEELADELHTRTQGNAELLTLSIDSLRKVRNPARFIDSLTESEDVERFLLREINANLSDVERDVMGAIAVLLGYPGTRHAIAAILGGQTVRSVLRDLDDRFLLTVHRSDEGREYGQHAMVQAFYYDELSRRQRQSMHRRAGEYYRDDKLDLLKAATHFDRAGDPEQAAQLVTEDVWGLINQGQSRAALDLLQRLESQQLDTAEWIEVKLAGGQVYGFFGDSEPARACYQEVLSHLPAQAEAADGREQAHAQKASAYLGLGELLAREAPQEALTWLQRGLDESTGSDTLEQAHLNLQIGAVHTLLGNYEEAADRLERGLALLPEEPAQIRATALAHLSMIAIEQMGDVDRAISTVQEALQISQQLHDHFKTAEILLTLGSYRFEAGDWPDAAVDFQESLDIAERIGSDKARARCGLSLGYLYVCQGNDEQAEQHLETGLRLAKETHEIDVESMILLNLAELKLLQGEWDAAAGFLREAQQLSSQLGDNMTAHIVLGGWAQIKSARGQSREAFQDAERAVDLASEAGVPFDHGISLRILGQVLEANGEHDAALGAFRESASILPELAPYEAARTQMQWGLALLAGGVENEACPLLEVARNTFQTLGARRELAVLNQQVDAE